MDSVVIAGGVWQRFIIKYLKSKGYKVHVVNPVKSETVSFADNWIQLDVKDVDNILKSIEAIRPDFVTSDQSEVASLPVALLSERLGLPGNDPRVVSLFVNKSRMYEFAQQLSIPVPPFREIENPGQVLEFIEEHGFPVIIKPTSSTSSRGFAKITADTVEKLPEYYKDCRKYSPVLVQKFVDGTEITVEGCCSAYRHRTLTTSLKKHFRPGIASSLRYPSKSPAISKITKYNDRFVNRSGLKFGNTHAEYMIDPEGKPWFIEIASRGGGCGISSEIVPWVTGISLHDVLLSNLMGNPIDITACPLTQKPAILQFYEFPDGPCDLDLDATHEDLIKIPGVHYWHFNFKAHQYLKPATNDQDRHALGILHAETEEDLDEVLMLVEKHLRNRKFYG
jgi:biotin carboxylase